MAFAGLHVVVGVANDIVAAQIGSAIGALDVLAATVPDRLAILGHEHTLVHVERPAVVAREPVHVGWVSDKQQVHTEAFHGNSCLVQTLGELGVGEVQFRFDHVATTYWLSAKALAVPYRAIREPVRVRLINLKSGDRPCHLSGLA